MLFNSVIGGLKQSYPLKISILVVSWLLVITFLHYILNTEFEDRPVIKMGYMPVITNFAAPLLDAASQDIDTPIRFKAIKFASFAEMAEALRNDEIQAGFIIAPLSIVLRQQGEDVKVVYIGNRHESTLVVRQDLPVRTFNDLEGFTVAVPMRYSGHNLEMLKLIDDAGLKGKINVVEMNPPDMASALTAGSLDAYFVGEPFAAQTLKSGSSKLLFHVEKVWPGFICNLLLVRQTFIDRNPEAVQMLVQGAARSGMWIKQNTAKAVEIGARYWGQPQDLVSYALNTPEHRIVFDQYTPREDEMQSIADMMQRFGLSKGNNIDGLVEDRFAVNANLENVRPDIKSILLP